MAGLITRFLSRQLANRLLEHFSSKARAAGRPKGKRRKLTYFSDPKEFERRVQEADPFLEEQSKK